ncbi:hypothetical protein Mic7113_4980 [Allocoleopsis franciscana PCC 7113]|uniref:Uncharacterized protein n=1 Tax=Allocoleopsis franciscana PCC 7113 TaxID=1173027 RepID=K9WLG8_9CYAN|nr:hypothetical protein Mic7113_4980 [Allocoleopsis franciscana PCC 7113]
MTLYREGQKFAIESRTIYSLVRELSPTLITDLITVKNEALWWQFLLPD